MQHVRLFCLFFALFFGIESLFWPQISAAQKDLAQNQVSVSAFVPASITYQEQGGKITAVTNLSTGCQIIHQKNLEIIVPRI